MEKKQPNNVFEKLDIQYDKLEDLSSKLEGISKNDLYALAKRIWDCEDFVVAQKYFNHISLLYPLEWEAPFYASLCNFKGYHNMYFWINAPKQEEKIYISTIKYILNLDLDSKEEELSKCLQIIKSTMLATKNNYDKNKKMYDAADSSYIFVLENLFIHMFVETKDLNFSCVKKFITFISDTCLEIINFTNKISLECTEQIYEEFIKHSSNPIGHNYKEIAEKATGSKELTQEEIIKIKMNGIVYFEDNDKTITKRRFIKSFLLGTGVFIISIIGMIFSILTNVFYLFAFFVSLLFGILLIIKAFTQKNRIKMSSMLCSNRKAYRLTSNNQPVLENKFSLIKLMIYFNLVVASCCVIFGLIQIFSSDNSFYVCRSISIICNYIFALLSLMVVNDHISDGKLTHIYNERYYTL